MRKHYCAHTSRSLAALAEIVARRDLNRLADDIVYPLGLVLNRNQVWAVGLKRRTKSGAEQSHGGGRVKGSEHEERGAIFRLGRSRGHTQNGAGQERDARGICIHGFAATITLCVSI